jgi:IS30 family transposase
MQKITKFKYLSASERSEIEILHRKGYSTRKIATVLGRSHNTVAYELRRCPLGYKALHAKIYARTKLRNRRFQWRKINQYKELQDYIVEKLTRGWNPHEISGRMKYEQRSFGVSTTSIYTWIQNDVRGERYQKYLYMYRFTRKRPRKRGLQGSIQHLVSIHDRPPVSVGTWETDLVVSSRKGTGALSTSNERISKYLVVDYVPDVRAVSKQKTLHRLEQEFFVESITFDRGHENSRHYQCTSKTYFCDPYSSYQRGANENQNKLLRRWFPKGTDFSKVNPLKITEVVEMINHKPRKSLCYRTAREVAMELGIIKS